MMNQIIILKQQSFQQVQTQGALHSQHKIQHIVQKVLLEQGEYFTSIKTRTYFFKGIKLAEIIYYEYFYH